MSYLNKTANQMPTVQCQKLVRYSKLAMTLVNPNGEETFGNQVFTIYEADISPPSNLLVVFGGVSRKWVMITVELFKAIHSGGCGR